jgi:hypothetical protein
MGVEREKKMGTERVERREEIMWQYPPYAHTLIKRVAASCSNVIGYTSGK